MRPYLTALALGAALAAPLSADEPKLDFREKLDLLEKFTTFYHGKPAPERVPAMLDLLLDKDTHLPNGPANRPVVLSHAFGHMARGNPQLIRLYESRFMGTNAIGKTCILNALQICGDDTTRRQLGQWITDPALADCRNELEATRTFLADVKQRPRDRPARTPDDLDLLWADFFVTGEYAPVARILDILDRPGTLREKITAKLKKGGDDRKEFLEYLREVKLIEPGTTDRLIAGELELVWLHDARGRLRQYNLCAAAYLESHVAFSKEDESDVMTPLLLRCAASHSLQHNLKRYPRLVELLKKHYEQRPSRSQDLVKKWLRIDQPEAGLDPESQRLQGTWQDVKDTYVRWKFEEDELHLTYTSDGGTFITSYKIDAVQNPKVIEIPCMCNIMRGIYQVDGDILKICTSTMEGALPNDFSPQPGSDCTLITLKRVPDR